MSNIHVEDEIVSGNIFHAFPDTATDTATVFFTPFSFKIKSINGVLLVIWFISLIQCLYQLRKHPNIKYNNE